MTAHLTHVTGELWLSQSIGAGVQWNRKRRNVSHPILCHLAFPTHCLPLHPTLNTLCFLDEGKNFELDEIFLWCLPPNLGFDWIILANPWLNHLLGDGQPQCELSNQNNICQLLPVLQTSPCWGFYKSRYLVISHQLLTGLARNLQLLLERPKACETSVSKRYLGKLGC